MKTFNEIRMVKAILKPITVTGYETLFAVDHGCDGFPIVKVEVPPAPVEVKDYLEGDEDLTVFAVPSNVTKLGNYALGTYPNLRKVYFFGTTLKTLNPLSLAGLDYLEEMYIGSDLYDLAMETYPEYADKWTKLVTEYTWDVDLIGTTLTIEIMSGLVAMLSQGQKNTISRIIIPSGYTNFELGFSEKMFDGTFTALTTIEYVSHELLLDTVFSSNKNNDGILEVE